VNSGCRFRFTVPYRSVSSHHPRVHGPFREATHFLLCPRCGEILERTIEALAACLRCEGLWITPQGLPPALGAGWPAGRPLWWRNALVCPECSAAGSETVMTAEGVEGIIVDRCHAHGLWFDRGEVARLLGATGDDLAALRERLRIDEADLARLAEQRAGWQENADRKRQAAEALALQRRQRAGLARAERESAMRAELSAIAEARTEAEARARVAAVGRARIELRDAGAAVAELERTLQRQREELRVTETNLVAARARLRDATGDLEALERA
jgi:Zn-finger nucleic acid-binding protein